MGSCPVAWDGQFSKQKVVQSQEALFDFDEFLQYNDGTNSSEVLLPSTETANANEHYSRSTMISPATASTVVFDDFCSDDYDSSLSYGDFRFPCPPIYSEMPLFDTGYMMAPSTTIQYNKLPSIPTPVHSRQSSQASLVESSVHDPPSPHLYNEPMTPPENRFTGERTLLPRVRPQDQIIKTSPTQSQKTPISKHRASAPAGVVRRIPRSRPGHSRAASLESLVTHLMGDQFTVKSEHFPRSQQARTASPAPSSIARMRVEQRRRHSTQLVNDEIKVTYGRAAYKSTPTYVSASLDMQSGPAAVLTFSNKIPSSLMSSAPLYDRPKSMPTQQSLDSLQRHRPSPQPVFDRVPSFVNDTNSSVPQTTLMAYLTVRNPCPHICTEINPHQTVDKSAMWWWWDIRQVRPWTSFTIDRMLSDAMIHHCLIIQYPSRTLTEVPNPGSTSPKYLIDLKSTLGNWIMPRLNSALSNYARPDSSITTMRFGDGTKQADFVSVPNKSTGATHVVGIIRTWTHWNSGMISERVPKRIQYLRGLAELHGKMRESSCRYGFIMNETEVSVVRNGTEEMPYFGSIEIVTIPLSSESSCASTGTGSSDPSSKPKMTALLALFYLHLIASEAGLEGQARYSAYIGAPVEMTRSNVRVEEKDSWIPDIKPGLDGRPAKSARGWVMPGDVLSSREKKAMKGVRFGNYRGRG